MLRVFIFGFDFFGKPSRKEDRASQTFSLHVALSWRHRIHVYFFLLVIIKNINNGNPNLVMQNKFMQC